MRRVILTVGADFHGGSKFGLLNPDTILYAEDQDGNQKQWAPSLTACQDYLWKLYENCIDKAQALAGTSPMMFLHNGDECHGNKYPQSLVSTRMSDQVIIARDNLRPVVEIAPVTRLAAGTGAHNFGEGSSTQLVAEMLADRYREKDIKPVYHGLIDLDGFEIDYSHHGPFPGSRSWLEGNVARFYLRDLMDRELRAGRKPPDLVLRAHYHTPVIETLRMNGFTSTLMILPSMCMVDDHTRQATRSVYTITNGLTGFEIVDGKLLNIHEWHQSTDIRTKEAL